jgi:thiamine biosynthesis lipoprotein
MGPVLRIWHERRMQGLDDPAGAALPSMQALQDAAGRMAMEDVVIDEAGRTVFLRLPGMSLDVGSVAKGYAAGLAMAAAEEAGLRAGLLSVGGHVVAIGIPPGRDHWNVGVRNPDADIEGAPGHVDVIAVTRATVSTSGVDQRYYMVGGERFAHIIDPGTLMPADRHRQVVVVHAESWMADVVSTALFILPREEGEALAAAAGAEAFWIDRDGRFFATPGYALVSSVFQQREQ